MPKSLTKMNVTDRKIDLIMRLYIDPADEDYIAARAAYSSGLFHVFYWCAAQSCEKYLKAALLLQDRSTQDYRHDIVSLYNEVLQHDRGNLLPEHLELPETTAMGRETWQGKNTILYIAYLAQYGSPDNRYGFHGTFVNGPVLHALDLLCCALRRMMNTTNLTARTLFDYQTDLCWRHEHIDNNQDWMIDPRRMLERLFVGRYQVGETRTLYTAFYNMNFAFFSTRRKGERSFGGHHFLGSPLHNHLVRLGEIEPSPANREVVEQIRQWASQNIYMTKEVRDQLRLPRSR